MIDFVRCRSEETESGFVWVYSTTDEEGNVQGHGPFSELSDAVIDSGISSTPEKLSDDLHRYEAA